MKKSVLLSPGNKKLFTYTLIGIVTILYAGLLFNLINRHSVNILYADGWDFNIYLFDNPTVWEAFSHQHGPHRQGIGAFVSLLVGSISGWNMRAEAFCIGGILVLAGIGALYLKYRLFGKLIFWDVLIPIICISFIQCEIAFPNTNLGYTSIPLLLVILSAIVLTLENAGIRYALLVPVNFLSVFTGMGIFMGPVIPVILIFGAFTHWRNAERRKMLFALGAFAASLLTMGLFFTNYHFAPAVDCFQFPHPRPFEYGIFISNMLTMCIGFIDNYKVSFARPFGLFLLAFWMIGLIYQFWTLVRTRSFSPIPLVIFTFFSFSIIYAVNTAIGRVCGGTDFARSTRYMTLLIPGWLALYFSFLLLRSDVVRNIVLAIFFLLLGLLPLRQYKKLDSQAEFLTTAKQKWAACYIEKENLEECDRESGINLHPNYPGTHLHEKLNLLKQNRYNLFSTQ